MHCLSASPAGDEADETLAVLLERVGSELTTLARVVADMQVALGPILSDASAKDPSICHHAQGLDLLNQTLESLGVVLSGASRVETGRVEAGNEGFDIKAIVGDLPLACLSKRLQGIRRDAVDHDLDLF